MFLIGQGYPTITVVVGGHAVRHINANQRIGQQDGLVQDQKTLPPWLGLPGKIRHYFKGHTISHNSHTLQSSSVGNQVNTPQQQPDTHKVGGHEFVFE